MAGHQHLAETVHIALDVFHKSQDAGVDRPQIMGFDGLSLGRRRADQGAAAQLDVRPTARLFLIDEEIFLLRADGHVNGTHGTVAEQFEQTHGPFLDGADAFQQRRFHVQRRAIVGDEHRRDAERAAFVAEDDEGRTGRIPGAISTGLKGIPHAPRREGRSVGFALDQFLAAEGVDRMPLAVEIEKGHVPLRRDFRPRLKPVGIMRRAFGKGPFLHGRRHVVGDRTVELAVSLDRRHQTPVYVLRQTFLHGRFVENMHSKNLRRTGYTFIHLLQPPPNVFAVLNFFKKRQGQIFSIHLFMMQEYITSIRIGACRYT